MRQVLVEFRSVVIADVKKKKEITVVKRKADAD